MPPAAPSVARSRGGRREGGKLGQRRRRWQRLGLPGLSMSQQPTLARRISLCLCLCVCAALGAAQSGSCRDKKNCKVVFSQQELRKRLTPLQYHVTQEKGTESAFEGEYTHHKDPGIYKCVVCGTPLFKSETKFDSGSVVFGEGESQVIVETQNPSVFPFERCSEVKMILFDISLDPDLNELTHLLSG
nr:methionine-R-sulfoxide reductase B3 isoform X1 [Loxodonta africana]